MPVFLREGALVLTQDTEHVTQTKQLTDHFNLVAGFKFNGNRSDADHKVYDAIGAMISIGDYEDTHKIDECLKEGCEYIFNTILRVTPTAKTLEIDVSYTGGLLLTQKIIIDRVTVYFEDEAISTKLTTPLEILGPRSTTIPLVSNLRV